MPSSKKITKSKTNVKKSTGETSSMNQNLKEVESTEASTTEASTTEASTTEASTTEVNVDELVVEEVQNLEFENQYNQLSEVITQLSSQVKEVQMNMKNLHRIHSKEIKSLEKRTKKKRTGRDGKNSPSGFTQPTKITDDLALFLGVEKGSMLPRTEVTKKVNTYIKEHGLQWPQNKRHIKPDKKLGKLLNVGKDEDLTYFNLQTYLKPHYIKKIVV